MLAGFGTAGVGEEDRRGFGVAEGEFHGGNGPDIADLQLPADDLQRADCFAGDLFRSNLVVEWLRCAFTGAEQGRELLPLGSLPFDGGRGVGRLAGGAGQVLHQTLGQLLEVEIVGGQIDGKLIGGFDFSRRLDFVGRECPIAAVPVLADHLVERLAVVALEVVRAGIVVDVLVQVLGRAEQLDRSGRAGFEQRRQGVRRGEAAIVLLVVGQQGDARGEHRRQMRVVGMAARSHGRLLGVAEVRVVRDRA